VRGQIWGIAGSSASHIPSTHRGNESEYPKVEYTALGSEDVQLPCMLPPLRSILSPVIIGHVLDTAFRSGCPGYSG
jgi:hypothetical protein